MHTNINVENLSLEIEAHKEKLCKCCNKELDESKFCNHCESGEHKESLKTVMKKAGVKTVLQKFHLTNCFIYEKKYTHSKEYYDNNTISKKTVRKNCCQLEEKPIRCSYCGGDGYYSNEDNDVKCDHCVGTGICSYQENYNASSDFEKCDECVELIEVDE